MRSNHEAKEFEAAEGEGDGIEGFTVISPPKKSPPRRLLATNEELLNN